MNYDVVTVRLNVPPHPELINAHSGPHMSETLPYDHAHSMTHNEKKMRHKGPIATPAQPSGSAESSDECFEGLGAQKLNS